MLSSFKLSTKLILGYMAVSAFVVGIGVFGYYSCGRINDMLNSLYLRNLVPSSEVANANMQAIYHVRSVYTLPGEENKEEISRVQDRMAHYEKKMTELLDEYRKTELSDKEISLLKRFDEAWPVYKSKSAEILAMVQRGEQAPAAAFLKNEIKPSFKVVDDILSEIVDYNTAAGKKAYEDSDEVFSGVKKTTFAGILAGFLASGLLGFFISRSISRVLTEISRGLAEASEQVASAGVQLTAASQQVSSGSVEAASSLEETVASIEELTSMVNTSAANSQQAAHLAKVSNDSAEQGTAGMQNLISSIHEISASSKKIEEIITVIDDISFQINLLALNAAVEAARAGEQGKGFAVVAEAVRTLAQKSAEAAKGINLLITESVAKTDTGTRLAAEADKSLGEISVSVKKVGDLIQEVSAAAQEQAAGISQISKAMQTLDVSTQQNAAASEEVAASSGQMSSQAQLLQNLVQRLTAVIDGGSTANQGTSAPPTATLSAGVSPALNAPGGGRSLPNPSKLKKPAHSSPEKVLPLDEEESDGRGRIGQVSGF